MLHPARRLLAPTLLVLALAAPGLAAERLVLIGGGDKPALAVERFCQWAGRESARILVVLWSTSIPQESFEYFREQLGAYRPRAVEAGPLAPLDPSSRQRLLDQLARATGVFFSGGDQGRSADVLLGDRPLLEALRARYREGVVFGGTSAGAAVMSRIMLTGNGDFSVIDAAKVETREGLGLLPNAIVDQHFIRRQRQNRLFGLVLAHPEELGIGIDEDAALLVEDGRHAEVVGGTVMLVDGRQGSGRLLLTLLGPGDRYDLRDRKPR